jgi:TatA/E family protein of Tat protein translocase
MLSGFENPFHLLIVAVVILLLFGARRLPEMGRSLGSGMREFRDGVMGREPGAPAQGALGSSAESANHPRQGNPLA